MLAGQSIHSGLNNIVLAHLSEQNNHPAIVEMVANEALQLRGLGARLTIAKQDTPSEVLHF